MYIKHKHIHVQVHIHIHIHLHMHTHPHTLSLYFVKFFSVVLCIHSRWCYWCPFYIRKLLRKICSLRIAAAVEPSLIKMTTLRTYPIVHLSQLCKKNLLVEKISRVTVFPLYIPSSTCAMLGIESLSCVRLSLELTGIINLQIFKVQTGGVRAAAKIEGTL